MTHPSSEEGWSSVVELPPSPVPNTGKKNPSAHIKGKLSFCISIGKS